MKLPAADLEHILAHTRELWDELRGQTIFITGGTGFFGAWLLESFVHANETLGLQARAVVLTRNPEAFAVKSPHLAARVELIQGDVRGFRFPAGTFSHVIHAGTTSGSPVEPGETFDTILGGTRRTLEFAATHGTRKLLFVSSGAVYGRQPAELPHVGEDYLGAPDPLDATSAYGEGKRAAELLCGLAGRQHGFEIKVARCFAFVGPHLPLDAHFAIGNFIRDGLRGGPIRVGGDGTPLRSYLYAADLAVWLWTILFQGAAGAAYNVGSEEALCISAVAKTVAGTFEPAPAVVVAKAAIPGAPAQRYIPSTARARRELSLAQWIDLPEAIRRTARWAETGKN